MILFLDDEIFAKPYSDALKDRGLEVEHVTSIYNAYLRLKDNAEKYKILLLDCMLPVKLKDKNLLKEYEIKDGLRAGSAFIEYITEKTIAPNIKIVIITNIHDEEFHQKYQRCTRVTGCYRKSDVKPQALAVKILNFLRGCK